MNESYLLCTWQVRVLVGDPIPMEDLLQAADTQQWPDAQLYRAITARIADSMVALKVSTSVWPHP